MFENDGCAAGAVLSVACPGGMARQFRVQVRDEEAPARWRLLQSFREPASAERLARQVSAGGAATRVVDCRALPTAL